MTAPGAGDLECSSENHMPVPGAGGAGGRKEAGIRLRLPRAIEKQKEKRQEPTGQKEAQALLGLNGERGSK